MNILYSFLSKFKIFCSFRFLIIFFYIIISHPLSYDDRISKTRIPEQLPQRVLHKSVVPSAKGNSSKEQNSLRNKNRRTS